MITSAPGQIRILGEDGLRLLSRLPNAIMRGISAPLDAFMLYGR